MKTINRTCGDVFREVGAAASHVASCVMLAILLTILPLALTLFAVFLLAKIAIALVAGYQYNKRRGKVTPHKDI
jgi:hypothetical protein